MKMTKKFRKRPVIKQEPIWLEYAFSIPRFYDDFSTRDSQQSLTSTGVTTPAVNIIETNEDYRLEMVAPGMKKESFKVELQNGVLTITYDHDDNREGERRDWKYLTHEYNYHSFSRSFSLPDAVDAQKIEARYENGILNLLLPKRDEARKKPARQITIE